MIGGPVWLLMLCVIPGVICGLLIKKLLLKYINKKRKLHILYSGIRRLCSRAQVYYITGGIPARVRTSASASKNMAGNKGLAHS